MTAHLIVLAALAAGTLAPAPAQPTSAPAAAHEPKAKSDLNERICEDIMMTGSRLAVRRFCATRSEWADKRLQDRRAVERVQSSPCVVQRTGSAGRSSC